MLFVMRPRLIIPTVNATKETFLICNKRYENGHSKSNKGNAFRHALWNVLIAKESLEKTKNDKKSANWAQKVTDLYEKVTQNSILDEQMDLHNNAIGRDLFLKFPKKSKTEITDIIYKKSTKAIKIQSVQELENLTQDMVYLID